MTEIDHRAEAEKLLATGKNADYVLARALVHATLAASEPSEEVQILRELARIERERGDKHVSDLIDLQNKHSELHAAVRELLALAPTGAFSDVASSHPFAAALARLRKLVGEP